MVKKRKKNAFWEWMSTSSALLYAFGIASVIGLFGIALNDFFGIEVLLDVSSYVAFFLVGILMLFMSKISKNRFSYWKKIFGDGVQGGEFMYVMYFFLGAFSTGIGLVGLLGNELTFFTEIRGFIAIIIVFMMAINLYVEIQQSVKRVNR